MIIEKSQPDMSISDQHTQLPSLKRLNALENEDGSFQFKLSGIAAIIGLPTDALDCELTNFNNLIPKQRHPSRLDWVLRWLLTKLQTDGEAGYQ